MRNNMQFQCQCNDSPDYKLVTAFGCKEGGMPYCAHSKDLVCQNGDIVDREAAIEASLQKR